ncbi:hypothetical protein JHK85_044369 [Glycine max]|nr:hypothetical protein JHK85_044369 [Glycine max]
MGKRPTSIFGMEHVSKFLAKLSISVAKSWLQVMMRSRSSLPMLMNYWERLGLSRKLTLHDAENRLQCVAESWYQYLRHNDFSVGDEICLYFREIVSTMDS